jgi:hypothetical protein
MNPSPSPDMYAGHCYTNDNRRNRDKESGNQSTRGTDHPRPFTKTSRRWGPAPTIYLSGGLSLDCFIIITVSSPKADKVGVEYLFRNPDPWHTGGIRRTTEDDFVSLRDRQIDSRLRSQVRPSPSSLLFQVSQPQDARGFPDSQLLAMIFLGYSI